MQLLLLLLLALPPQLQNMVRVETPTKLGWGVPISSLCVLTANHLVIDKEDLQISNYQGKLLATAHMTWLDPEDDLALIIVDAPVSWEVFRFSTKDLQVGDAIFWTGFLKEAVPTMLRGYNLGIDDDGDLIMDGWAAPGASGSGILNSEGEIVGIVVSSFTLHNLAIRSLGVGVPNSRINKKWKK